MELTAKDFELIRRQCEIQQDDSDESIENFTQAYRLAKGWVYSIKEWREISSIVILDLVKFLGALTKPRTQGKFRLVPAVFQSGGKGVDPEHIPGKMENWAQAFVERKLSPEEIFFEFESIHPFEDGNGRVGHLLWAIYTKSLTNEWPEVLPPDVFAKGVPSQSESAFGEVER